tara:strand:- start:156 stop:296 length:141 start_codon:yes stop_codon:yes gene_type:complete
MNREINVTITLSDEWEEYDGYSDEELMEIMINSNSDSETMEIKIND